jgi:hypothetical protein
LLCAFLVSLLPFFVLPLSSTTPNTSPNSTFFFVSYYHFLLLINHTFHHSKSHTFHHTFLCKFFLVCFNLLWPSSNLDHLHNAMFLPTELS